MHRRAFLGFVATGPAGILVPAIVRPRARVFDMGRDSRYCRLPADWYFVETESSFVPLWLDGFQVKREHLPRPDRIMVYDARVLIPMPNLRDPSLNFGPGFRRQSSCVRAHPPIRPRRNSASA